MFDIFKWCSHDWEVVGYGDTYKFKFDGEIYYNKSSMGEQSKKKVCLKCGRCIDEEKEWVKEYEKQEEKKRIDREEKVNRGLLAKKMWKDCNKI